MDEKLSYYRISLKSQSFRGGVHEKPIYRGQLPEKGGWTVCRFKGGLAKRRG